MHAHLDMTATTGTFDGVHAGHRYLLRCLRQMADLHGRTPLVLVLSPHPLQVVCPQRAPGLLMTAAERTDAIRQVLPDAKVEMLHFDERLRRLTHREFMAMLHERYGVKALLVGHDNRFGSDRDTTPKQYEATGRELGIDVKICNALPGVSSSIIRKLLADGDVAGARRMLCAPYALTGQVMHGHALGRTIGFPTANIAPADSSKLVPAPGVYAACAVTDEGRSHPAMVNIGTRPTVSAPDTAVLTIEAHLPGFNGNLYGRQLTLLFEQRLREERRFPSVEALRRQLVHDAEMTKNILASDKNNSKHVIGI